MYPKTVEIFVKPYMSASSSWSTGNDTEFQSVNTTIDADSWPNLQRKTKENLKHYKEIPRSLGFSATSANKCLM